MLLLPHLVTAGRCLDLEVIIFMIESWSLFLLWLLLYDNLQLLFFLISDNFFSFFTLYFLSICTLNFTLKSFKKHFFYTFYIQKRSPQATHSCFILHWMWDKLKSKLWIVYENLLYSQRLCRLFLSSSHTFPTFLRCLVNNYSSSTEESSFMRLKTSTTTDTLKDGKSWFVLFLNNKWHVKSIDSYYFAEISIFVCCQHKNMIERFA